MAHYAYLDENNIVTQVIVGPDENYNNTDWEQFYGEYRGVICKRTSYNTQGGVHLTGGIPFRKNYAGIGYYFDEARDAFVPPKPYPSWILNEDSCLWEPPVAYPTDGKQYVWNEENTNWVEVE